ncbi:MAG: O-antigen ligase family protein [Proteobacteria bacterium]|nr:O-antigen ligase family protein [Pseudomonadota bacterium]
MGVFILITTFNPPEKKLKDGNWLKIISIAFFVIGFAEAIYGLYLYLNHSDSLLWFTRIYYKGFVDGTYINKNHLAGFMNMCIFISIGFLTSYIGSYRKKGYRLKETFLLILTTKKTIFIYLIIFGLLTMILAVIFSNSRMGQFSLIAGSIFLCILYTVKRLKNFLFILIFIFCMATAWGIWKGVEPVIERWNATDADFIGRNDVWKSTLKMSRDFPILGTGLGTYELAFPPFKPEKIGVGIVDHAHNDYLEMLSEVGWAGFVCWLSFFFMYLYFTISAWIQKQGAFSRGMGAGGIAATIATLIHSLADFNLQIPANALLLFIVMAITWQAVHTSFST